MKCAPLLLLLSVALHADERVVTPGGAGPNRLDPDAVLMARAQPLRYSEPKTPTSGLDDLRFHDAAGREVPYLLVAPRAAREEWISERIFPVAATKTTSGFEADLGTVRIVDRLRIEGLAAPVMKRLTLEGSGDRSHYTLLAREATIFDLPAENLRRLDVDFAAGEYRYLRVTWDDRSSAVVRHLGSAAARLRRADAAEENARIAVPFRNTLGEPGRSHYRVQLPGPHLPVASIEIVCSNENVLRHASVTESRLAGSELRPVDLGATTIRKSSREGISAANLAVPISFPETADLDLAVDDGNNPPLTIERIDARFAPLPWIYFETADAKPLTATFGDSTLRAPRYDLEAMGASLASVKPAHASWSPAAPTPSSTTAAAEIVFRGAAVKRADYRYSRAIAAAPRGVARLLLDAEVLAHSADLADVRIVDGASAQVPFIVERRSDPLVLDLKVPQRTERDGRSVYRLDFPYETLPAHTRLVVRTSARVFSREVELRRVNDESARDRRWPTITTTAWSSADPEREPPALTFEVPLGGMKSVELAIGEGDNAPLPITSARVLVPSVALRFWDPGKPLTLLYGNPNVGAPRYDIQLLASRILATPARDISLATTPPAAPERMPAAMKWFWIAIAVVAIVLFFVLAQLIAAHTTEPS